jgi:hypothetical protein
MFSADGHTQNNILGYSTPSIAKQDDEIRQDIILLLYSVGVACKENIGNCKGYITHAVWISNTFVEKIGYLQPYKNENLNRAYITKNKWDLVPSNVGLYLVKQIKASGIKLKSRTARNTLNEVLRGKRNLSRNKVISYLNEVGIEIPWWLNYQFIQVKELIKTDKKEMMYDIEVFDDKHLFLANFIGVHNSQGSNPKGILKINGNTSEGMLNQFKQAWYNQIAGVNNAWKIPVIQSDKMDWIDLQKNNTDMQFQLWAQYLRLIACALYKMDPIEVGFRGENEGPSLFGKDDKTKINHSKEKGLEPLLKFWAKDFNKSVISEITEDYEFVFTGVTPDDEQASLESDIKKVTNIEQLNEVRKRRGLPAIKDGDVVLNSAYLQYQQMKQMGSPDSNAAMDQETGDSSGNAYAGESDNPFENIEQSVKDQINGYTDELLKASYELNN